MNKAQKGYRRLFINLGKRDGFYPGELMQTLNRYVGGRQEVGHIDLLDTISYFEVPEKDARKVMTPLTGIRYKGRTVRCNAEEEGGHKASQEGSQRPQGAQSAAKGSAKTAKGYKGSQRDDWKQFFQHDDNGGRRGRKNSWELKGAEPDFDEEGWARRKPKRKK
jgi:ATP-dependent RNA helicase DeaD